MTFATPGHKRSASTVDSMATVDKTQLEAMISMKVRSFAQPALDRMMPMNLPEKQVETAMFFP